MKTLFSGAAISCNHAGTLQEPVGICNAISPDVLVVKNADDYTGFHFSVLILYSTTYYNPYLDILICSQNNTVLYSCLCKIETW